MQIKITLLICALLGGFGTLLVFPSVAPPDGGWKQALPGYVYDFPRDHAVHPDFKTEWWYFTGNLRDERGQNFGYELTFFRQGVLAPSEKQRLTAEDVPPGRFVQSDFKFAHFAISDLAHKKFHFTQEMNRGAFGEAGFGTPASDAPSKMDPPHLAWITNWELKPQANGTWKISATASGADPMSIELEVLPLKPPIIEGTDGVSQKAAGLGNASHYYSFTRLKSTGTLSVGKNDPGHIVQGESWFDHEWASNQLGADEVGWDWFCFQFDDHTELMLYAMRRRDGSMDPVSSGTWVTPEGVGQPLRREDFSLRVVRQWKSPATGAVYPVEWQVSLPGKQLKFALKPCLDDQELALPMISYWEGAITAEGKRDGHDVRGHGYMELTGYAGMLKSLQGSEKLTGGDIGRAGH